MSVLFEISILGTPPPVTASSLSQRSAARQDFRFWTAQHHRRSGNRTIRRDPWGCFLLVLMLNVTWSGSHSYREEPMRQVTFSKQFVKFAEDRRVKNGSVGTSSSSAWSGHYVLQRRPGPEKLAVVRVQFLRNLRDYFRTALTERETWCNGLPAVQFKIDFVMRMWTQTDCRRRGRGNRA